MFLRPQAAKANSWRVALAVTRPLGAAAARALGQASLLEPVAAAGLTRRKRVRSHVRRRMGCPSTMGLAAATTPARTWRRTQCRWRRPTSALPQTWARPVRAQTLGAAAVYRMLHALHPPSCCVYARTAVGRALGVFRSRARVGSSSGMLPYAAALAPGCPARSILLHTHRACVRTGTHGWPFSTRTHARCA